MTEQTNDAAEQPREEEPAAAPAPRTSKARKRGVIAAVVVVAIVALAVGGFAWHNTPSFCGTVCHEPMGEFVANFEGTDASSGAGIASLHAQEGYGCLDCHEATLETQIAEAQSFIANDYPKPLFENGTYYYTDNEKCLSCHGGTYDALAELTADLGRYNPHNSPHGQQNCNECHQGHAAQINVCERCHTNGGQTMVN